MGCPNALVHKAGDRRLAGDSQREECKQPVQTVRIRHRGRNSDHGRPQGPGVATGLHHSLVDTRAEADADDRRRLRRRLQPLRSRDRRRLVATAVRQQNHRARNAGPRCGQGLATAIQSRVDGGAVPRPDGADGSQGARDARTPRARARRAPSSSPGTATWIPGGGRDEAWPCNASCNGSRGRRPYWPMDWSMARMTPIRWPVRRCSAPTPEPPPLTRRLSTGARRRDAGIDGPLGGRRGPSSLHRCRSTAATGLLVARAWPSLRCLTC